MSHTRAVFTIAPDKPFVDVLARQLLEQAGHDPMQLAQMRILLPTRRAIRSLREAFLRMSEGKPMLLPNMQPVGDVDEEEMLLGGFLHGAEDGEHTLPPVMPGSRRVLLLAGLIWRYHQMEYGFHSRMDQAVQLARELASLLDEVAREELDIHNIQHIVPEELADHWKLTLQFLTIIIDHWPQILRDEGKLDPITRRNRLLHLLAENWQTEPPAYPVIIAGTTGSTPATAKLIDVVSRMPQGMVVLPGWDTHMREDEWDALANDAQQAHPQYGMRQLLQRLDIPREDVRELNEATADAPRVALLKAALAPAEQTAEWHKTSLDWQQALQGFSRIDCATQQEEATVVALLLRDAVQQQGKTAALITPNRDLARRVSAVLRRFHVEIDDSAGIPLSDTPAGMLLSLVTGAAMGRGAPVPLLSLLKHPMCLMGYAAGGCRHLARLLERYSLRGVRLSEGLEALREQIAKSNKIPPKQQEELTQFAECIANILAPMLEAMASHRSSLRHLLQAHIAVAEALSTNAEGEVTLWQGEEGEQLSAFLHEVLASAEGMAEMDAASYAGVFSALLAGRVWRPQYGMHPRLHILSPMEARLQLYDRVVLSGLNEGGWPMDAGQDPWMSRPMRSAFGLSLPERQTGLSAHDFYALSAAKEVVLTRADKEAGSPTVPSRWLLRLEALLGVLGGVEAQTQWLAEGKKWRQWAEQADAVDNPQPCEPPAPTPPVDVRPRELSVTRVETLLRNPYGIYAQKILNLKMLDPLDQDPGAREFGTVVHDAIEKYILSGDSGYDALIACGREAFADLLQRPSIEAFWWPRFCRIVEWLVEEEMRRKGDLSAVEAEIEGVVAWDAPAGRFTLRAFVDRLETLHDGGVRIVDYKTGTPPAASDVAKGIAAQMPLEGVILRYGSFDGRMRHSAAVVDMEYWHLRGGSEAGSITSMAKAAAKRKESLEDWVQAAYAGAQALIAAYDDPATPYYYAPMAADKPKYDDYEHLARVKEWGVEA